MSDIEAPIEPRKLKINYTVYTTVLNVEEVSRTLRTWKEGEETKSEKELVGWFVHFEGSYEAINFGETRPHLAIGDRIKITFEKLDV